LVTPEINIKRADNSDAQLLSDLSNATFIETYRECAPDGDLMKFMDATYNEQVITEELENENDFYFIGGSGDSPRD